MKIIGRYFTILTLILVVFGFLIITIGTLAAASESKGSMHSSSYQNNGEPEHWRIMADMTDGRGDPGVVSYNGKIYAISGFWTPGVGYVDSVEIYDPNADEWEIRWGVPFARSDLMSAVISDSIYAIGGWRMESGVYDLNHKYDPDADSWITMTSMITAVSGAGVVPVKNDIYILGGFDGISNTNGVQIYHSDIDTWTLGTPLERELTEFSAVLLDNRIYAIGGVLRGGIVTNTVSVFDLSTKSWSSAAPLPEPRASMAVGVRDGKIHVAGGTDDWISQTIKDSAYEYNPQSDSWKSTTPIPTARRNVEAAVIGDIIYIVGGVGDPGAGTANEAYPKEPLPSTTSITSDDPDPSLENQPFTVKFSVTSAENIPTGIVSVTVAGVVETCEGKLVNGIGSCTLSISNLGNYTLTAAYDGDSVHSGSHFIEMHEVIYRDFLYLPFTKK